MKQINASQKFWPVLLGASLLLGLHSSVQAQAQTNTDADTEPSWAFKLTPSLYATQHEKVQQTSTFEETREITPHGWASTFAAVNTSKHDGATNTTPTLHGDKWCPHCNWPQKALQAHLSTFKSVAPHTSSRGLAEPT